MTTGTAGKPAMTATAGAGATGSTAPKAGSGAAPATTTTPAVAGKSGGAAGGSAGSAGSTMAAAGGGGTSAGAGMTGGSAGAAGGATAAAGGGAPSTGGFIREDAPTDASTKAPMGKYMVKSYTSGFSGTPTGFAAGTLYYPADADPPFASVAMVPGFASYQNSIMDWGPFLASHGIVIMTIDTLTTGDLPPQRADELMAAIKSIAGENDRADSPLKGKLDTSRQCVSGWSMGGGGTLIAAAAHPEFKCAVSFAAWQPSGGAMNKVPVLMFEGTADTLAAGMSEGYYQQTPDSVPKMLFEVAGGDHWAATSPKNSMGIIGQYGLSWFKVFLESDDRYRQFLTAPKPSITAMFETNVK